MSKGLNKEKKADDLNVLSSNECPAESSPINASDSQALKKELDIDTEAKAERRLLKAERKKEKRLQKKTETRAERSAQKKAEKACSENGEANTVSENSNANALEVPLVVSDKPGRQAIPDKKPSHKEQSGVRSTLFKEAKEAKKANNIEQSKVESPVVKTANASLNGAKSPDTASTVTIESVGATRLPKSAEKRSKKEETKANKQTVKESAERPILIAKRPTSSNSVTNDTPKHEKVPDQSPLSAKKTSEAKESSSYTKKVETKSSNMNNNKPRVPGEPELSPQFLQALEENKMHVLKKKNSRFPKARFFCRLCDYHMDFTSDCHKHIKDNRHSRRKEISDVDTVLRKLPEPTENQLAALTEAVDEVYTKHGLNDEDKVTRQDIVTQLELMVRAVVPDVHMFMYGSSTTCFGLKSSDININLNTSDTNRKLPSLMKDVYIVMRDFKDNSGFTNIRSDFSAKVPCLKLTHSLSGLDLLVCIVCYSAQCSAQLLSIYSDFDLRVRKLAVTFRYWAHLCGLDVHEEGFMPSQALNLMVIYFLQLMEPQLLPIIQPPKVSGEEIGDFSKDQPYFDKMRKKVLKVKNAAMNTMGVGELWLRMLRFYTLEFDMPAVVISIRSSEPMGRTTKPWNSKKLAVEDPYMEKKNITRTMSNSRVYEYWQDSIRKAHHFFGLARNRVGKAYLSKEDIDEISLWRLDPEAYRGGVPGASAAKVEGMSRQSSAAASDSGASVESDRSSPESEVVLGKDVDSSDVPCATEEKDKSKTEADSASSQSEKDVKSIVDEVIDGVNVLSLQSNVESETKDVLSSVKSNGSITTLNEDDSKVAALKSENIDSKESGGTDPFETASANSIKAKTDNTTSVPSDLSDLDDEFHDAEGACHATLTPGDLLSLVAKKCCCYNFTKESFTDGKGLVLVCTYCEKEGHLKNNCPDDKLPEICPLPPLTKNHLDTVTQTLMRVPADMGLSDEALRNRRIFLSGLELFVKELFPDADLELFGSSCNGFGFDRSDMDICMTFHNRRDKLDKVEIIEKLHRQLRKHQQLMQVQAITTAKVPIVKFTVKQNGLEGDISLYNTLAQQNTKLLYLYSQIDTRVRVLGYTIKTFAKVCDIGDASRGSLSSYAYILMMLYYLQQVKPPVIPVLQELYTGDKPTFIVENCDAWFMDDKSKLSTLWPEGGQNQMSVAELWLGFLRFYVEEFNYREYVVCIRQKEELTRFEKLWNGQCLAIEDPFDLSHNLGSGLTRKMNNFIFKTYINGRRLYGTPIDNQEMFKTYKSPTDYFFDTELLSEARPANIRGCRKCGKIGHLQRQCPIQHREWEEEKRERMRRQQHQQGPQHQQRDNRRPMMQGNSNRNNTGPHNMMQHNLSANPRLQASSPGQKYRHPNTNNFPQQQQQHLQQQQQYQRYSPQGPRPQPQGGQGGIMQHHHQQQQQRRGTGTPEKTGAPPGFGGPAPLMSMSPNQGSPLTQGYRPTSAMSTPPGLQHNRNTYYNSSSNSNNNNSNHNVTHSAPAAFRPSHPPGFNERPGGQMMNPVVQNLFNVASQHPQNPSGSPRKP